MDASDNIDPLPNFKKERTEQRDKKNKFSGKDKRDWLSKANHGEASNLRAEQKNKTLTHLNHKHKIEKKEIFNTLTKSNVGEKDAFSTHKLERQSTYSIDLSDVSSQPSFQYESISDEEPENVSETEDKKQLALERQQAEYTAELARLEKSFEEELTEEEDSVDIEQFQLWQKTKTILKNLQTTGILLQELKDKLSILKFSVDELNSNALELAKLKENSDIFQRLVAQINTEQFKMNALAWQLNEAIEQLNHQYDLIDLKFPDLALAFSGLAIEGEDFEEDMLYAEPEYNIEQALADYRKLKPELMGHYIAPKDELESQPEMEPEDPAQALKTQRTIDFNKKAQNHERDHAKLLRGKGLNYAFDRFKNRGIAEDAAVAQVATHFAKLENKPANSTKTEGINPEKNSSSKTGMMHGFDLHRRSATTPSSLKNKNGLDSNKAKYAHCPNSNQPHGNIERSQMREIPTFRRNRFGYPE